MNARDTALFESLTRFITDDDEQKILEAKLQDVIDNYRPGCDRPKLNRLNPWEAFIFLNTNDQDFWYSIARMYDEHKRVHNYNGDEE